MKNLVKVKIECPCCEKKIFLTICYHNENNYLGYYCSECKSMTIITKYKFSSFQEAQEKLTKLLFLG